jgi:hypothetical protein
VAGRSSDGACGSPRCSRRLRRRPCCLLWDPAARLPLAPRSAPRRRWTSCTTCGGLPTYHDSWLSLDLELAAILGSRSVYAAWIVRRAWRQGPGSAWSFVGAAGRALVFYATALVLLGPWVALLFGGAISHLSYLYVAALPPALAVGVVLHRGALSRPGQPWWWRPTRRTVAWEAGSLAWLTVRAP